MKPSLIADHLNAASFQWRNHDYQELLTTLGFNVASAALMYLAACREMPRYHFPL